MEEITEKEIPGEVNPVTTGGVLRDGPPPSHEPVREEGIPHQRLPPDLRRAISSGHLKKGVEGRCAVPVVGRGDI